MLFNKQGEDMNTLPTTARCFGERLGYLRSLQGLTQAALADKVGLSLRQISRIENGVSSPSYMVLEKIALALDTSLINLFIFNTYESRADCSYEGEGHSLENADSWEVELISSSLKGICVLGARSEKMNWSEDAYTLLGYQPYSIMPTVKRFLKNVHPDFQDKAADFIARVRHCSQGDFLLKIVSGSSVRTIAVHAQKLPPQSGENSVVHLILQDISDVMGLTQNLIANRDALEMHVRKRTRDLELAEKALRKINERLHSLYENTPAMLHSINNKGEIVSVSNMWLEKIGYTRDEVMGRRSVDFLTDESRRRAVEVNIPRFFETGSADDLPYQMVTKDGRILDVLMSGVSEYDEDGVFLRSMAVTQDVTERRKAEQALRESEHRFRALVENLPVMINAGTLEGVFSYWNKTCEEITGYSREEIIGNPQALSLLYPDKDYRERLIREVSQSGGLNKDQEWTLTAKDGSPRTIVCTNLHSDVGFTEDELWAVCVDITDRKRAEEALRESEGRFRTLLQSLPSISIQGYGPDGETLYWNKASERLYGYSEQEALGRNLLDLIIPPEMKDYVRKAISRMVEKGRGIPAEDVLLMRKDGSRVPVHSSHVIVPVHGDDPVLYCIDFDLTEMKRAEVELRKVSEMLQTTSRMARIGGWGKNLLTGEDEWSEVTREIHEVGPDFVPDMHNSLAFYKEGPSRDAIIESVTRLIETGEPYDVEVEFITAKGNELWIRTMGRAEFQDGRCIRIFGTFQDITESKQYEKALRESEARFRTLFNESPVSIIIHDKVTGEILDGNEAAYRAYGLDSLEALQAKEFWPAPPYSAQDALQWIHKAAAEGVQQFGWKNQTINGDVSWEHVTLRPVVIDGDERILSVAVDTTKRKQAEEMYHLLFREMLDGFALHEIICDDSGEPADYRFLSVNPAFERATGLKHEDIIGKTVLEVLPETEDHWIRTYGHVALTGEPVVFDNFSAALQKHFVVTAFSPRPLQFACIFADITDRKMAEEKIRTINAQLQKANAEKDKLFTIIAHDLKSPLAGIFNTSQILAQEAESISLEEIRLISAEMHKSSKNALELLNGLMQWAQMSQGGMDFSPEECSLSELVNLCLSTARDVAEKKDIAIKCEIPQDLTVLADQPMINTVIRNVIFNAVKFTNRGGNICITARKAGPFVEVCTRDNGIGMCEKVLTNAFSVDKSKRQLGTDGEKGTGLGLVLCKEFVEKHGGRIWLESTPGNGTKVFFTLPGVS